MKKFLCISFVSAVLVPLSAHSNTIYIKGDTVNPGDVNEAAIYFNGNINYQTVTWLLSSLADLHANYRNIKYVDVYLNSEGGDMDSGYVAFEALRKSPMKLNMINTAMVASSASMIYCAADDRYAMPMSTFVLHPAAAGNEKDDYLKPDQARRILDDAENYNSMFRAIYAGCTKIPADEIKKITSSETDRAVYKVDEAIRKGLVTRGIKETHSYPVTYYITDLQS
ncbi:ATP-dependent Clp protease proteolytic subunit [Enterobacter bugandensis]